MSMSDGAGQILPTKMTLKRDQGLEVTWADGKVSNYPLGYLRSMCPCASCKEVRGSTTQKKSSLTILPGNYVTPLTVTGVEKIGSYALRLDWSDQHGSGIYSFQYLREIMREK
jgi:DUF971 family protein